MEKKGTPKGSPKLKRSGRVASKGKYAGQWLRTFRNKLRRVRRCNGPLAAVAYERAFSQRAIDGGATERH